jgi:hypothetical protein
MAMWIPKERFALIMFMWLLGKSEKQKFHDMEGKAR